MKVIGLEEHKADELKKEMEILKMVNHPFLIKRDYIFTSGDRIYFIMEFLNGGDLFKNLKTIKRFTEE